MFPRRVVAFVKWLCVFVVVKEKYFWIRFVMGRLLFVEWVFIWCEARVPGEG